MKKTFVLIVLTLIFVTGTILWWNNGMSSVNPKDTASQIFIIPKEQGIRAIANDLKSKNLIKDPTVFFLLLKKEGLDRKVQAGSFRLNPSMNAKEVAQSLTHGTLDVWVIIPEGQRAEEIADTLEKTIPSYKEAWREKLVENEGYLFPDTYLIPKETDIDVIISLMKNNFEKKIKIIENAQTNLSAKQIVTIASMIEREAKYEEDRPLVASVILNRLNISMPLQIDATVQYALGYSKEEKTWWKKNLTAYELQIKSPYNTYENNGLPPTPISNPGLNSLSSVVNPANTDYLYYISDKSGRNHYSKTLGDHNAKIKKYGL